jgi:hypothetical protein
MKVIFNKDILLWSIGVLQPASASDALKFISYIYPEIKPLPLVKEIEQSFQDLEITALSQESMENHVYIRLHMQETQKYQQNLGGIEIKLVYSC